MAIVMTAFLVIGAITTFRAGELGTELILIGTMSLFAVAFLYSARERIKKIWRR